MAAGSEAYKNQEVHVSTITGLTGRPVSDGDLTHRRPLQPGVAEELNPPAWPLCHPSAS